MFGVSESKEPIKGEFAKKLIEEVTKIREQEVKPKYKVGDILQYRHCDGTVDTLHVNHVMYDERDKQYVYCQGEKYCYLALSESDVIGTIPHDEEEYQLYLKLKEKYG